jgi:CheY-like chemotaxis protein
MSDFLRENDCDVVAVQNGVEGVHEVLASEFDVILCDMLMPTLPETCSTARSSACVPTCVTGSSS